MGEDQVQHLEFVRECASNFNHVYGPVFEEPKTILCTSLISIGPSGVCLTRNSPCQAGDVAEEAKSQNV